MKTPKLKPNITKDMIAHQPLWMEISQESQEKISGGIGFGYKHLRQEPMNFSAGKLFKERVAG